MKIGNIRCYLKDSGIYLTDPVYPDGRFSKVKLEFLIKAEDAAEFMKWLRENNSGNFTLTTKGSSQTDRPPK
jgi:hypothetical protein